MPRDPKDPTGTRPDQQTRREVLRDNARRRAAGSTGNPEGVPGTPDEDGDS